MKPYQNSAPKREQIKEMFNRIAPTYDLLNHLLSLGVDRQWRSCVVRMLRRSGVKRVLDVATGTGDLSIAIARKIPQSQVVGVDLSPQMVAVAQQKVGRSAYADRISLQVADVEQLPFLDGEFDAVTVAFGVRNFQDIPAGLDQMFRVLKSGGKLIVLEFSTPRNKIFGLIYRFYFHRVLPMVGGWLSKDRNAYCYLPNSVDEFPSVERFKQIVSQAGFTECSSRSLFGGVAQIYSGTKKLS